MAVLFFVRQLIIGEPFEKGSPMTPRKLLGQEADSDVL